MPSSLWCFRHWLKWEMVELPKRHKQNHAKSSKDHSPSRVIVVFLLIIATLTALLVAKRIRLGVYVKTDNKSRVDKRPNPARILDRIHLESVWWEHSLSLYACARKRTFNSWMFLQLLNYANLSISKCCLALCIQRMNRWTTNPPSVIKTERK